MRRLVLVLSLGLLFVSPAAGGGVMLGGQLPTGLFAREGWTTAQKFTLRGQIKAVRWVNQTGRTVTRPTSGPLGCTLLLQPPAGNWTDLVLIFDGPVRLADDAHARDLSLPTLELALGEPLDSDGRAVTLHLDLTGLDAGWADLGGDVLASSLRDGALAWVEQD